MKIISGFYKNREIRSPELSSTHPMGERERLALFNMIATSVSGARVLDAYAGSGSLGIEALSRGADFAAFVEKNAKAAKVIAENLSSLGVGEDGEIYRASLSRFLEEYTGEKFKVILADPPYDKFSEELPEILRLGGFLRRNGVLVLSHPGSAPEIPKLKLEKTRKYAGARISIYRK